MNLKRQRRHERPDNHQSARNEHAALAVESIGHISKRQNPDHGAHEKGVGDSSLRFGGVFFSYEVFEDYVCCGGEVLLVAVGEVGEGGADDCDHCADFAWVVGLG